MGEDDLRSRIERARGDYDKRHIPKRQSATHGAAGAALMHAFQLVAAVLVGLAIGYGIDKLAGTEPWGLLIFLVFGTIAGFRNIIRSAQAMTQAALEAQAETDDAKDQEQEGQSDPPKGG